MWYQEVERKEVEEEEEEKERQWASTLSLEGEQKVSLVLGSRINILLLIRKKKHDSQLTGSYIIGWIGFYWWAKWLIKPRLWMPDVSKYGFLFQFHCIWLVRRWLIYGNIYIYGCPGMSGHTPLFLPSISTH